MTLLKRSFHFVKSCSRFVLAVTDRMAVNSCHSQLTSMAVSSCHSQLSCVAVNSNSYCRQFSSVADPVLSRYDQIQVKLMEEQCIMVNEKDEPLGPVTKKTCHLLEEIHNGMLHRAFSVFLFNSDNQLLLQQRSDHKITFPGLWTNTCCSHPHHTKLEMEADKALGVKRAAQRRLYNELGITPDHVPLDTFEYITRIQYMAENYPADDTFGESEIDYILIVKKDVKEVPLGINWNEVKSTRYVSMDELKGLIDQHDGGDVILTPWFRLICKKFLFEWWANMKKLKKLSDHKNIHRLN